MIELEKIIFRRARIKDCISVWNLCKMPGLVNPSGEPPKLWWIKEFVNKKQIFYIAELNKKVIGFILAEKLLGNVIYLWMSGVEKKFQGRGIGKRLYGLFEQECKNKKARVIITYAYSKNKKALKILKNKNFERGNLYYEQIKFL